MIPFFTNEETKKCIKNYFDFLNEINQKENFRNEQNETCLSLLRIMINAPSEWDQYTSYNKDKIGEYFTSELNKQGTSKKDLDLIFAYCIRFLIEFYLTTQMIFDEIYLNAKKFAYETMDSLSDEARSNVRFAFNGMALEMAKDIFSGEDFNVFKNFIEAKNSAEQLKDDWDVLLQEKEAEVRRLETSLNNHRHAFNFVMLNDGFSSLAQQKKQQLFWSRLVMILLGLSLPASIIFEMFFWSNANVNILSAVDYIRLIPTISLTLILIYYFRVSLVHFNSIKAQILQIEFRQTLCTFIQSYAEYSSDIKSKNANSLSKFEDIIFSNIMVTEDKIPSTFDGIDQLSSLINAMTGQKK
ncbi:hypothetical protein ACCX84_04485 [Pantoea trifolii]|uniref:hypothetical protein n=1 Tax=Pantoea trifolii TaxID=2968030 RepID=UPI003ED92AC2